MSRADYEVIAALIVKTREFHESPEVTEALHSLTFMLTGAFATANPNFKPELFIAKAGA